jgi:hypothetical protein
MEDYLHGCSEADSALRCIVPKRWPPSCKWIQLLKSKTTKKNILEGKGLIVSTKAIFYQTLICFVDYLGAKSN